MKTQQILKERGGIRRASTVAHWVTVWGVGWGKGKGKGKDRGTAQRAKARVRLRVSLKARAKTEGGKEARVKKGVGKAGSYEIHEPLRLSGAVLETRPESGTRRRNALSWPWRAGVVYDEGEVEIGAEEEVGLVWPVGCMEEVRDAWPQIEADK